MTRTPFFRLAAAAWMLLSPLSPVLAAGGQKGKSGAAPQVQSLGKLPALETSALAPLRDLSALQVGGVASQAAVPSAAVPAAQAAAPAGAAPVAAQGLSAAPAAPAAGFQPAASEPDFGAAWTVSQLPSASEASRPGVRGRAERIASTLLSWGRSAEKTPAQDAGAVRAKTSSFASGLKRSMRALAVGAALTIGALGNAQPALAQQPDPVRLEQQAQESRVLRAETIQQAIAQWNPSHHVIVIGYDRLPESAKAAIPALEQELKGTHKYVMLVSRSSNQSYVSDEGARRSGDEAVEFGMGQGIGGKPAFQGLIDARTDSPDGVLFLLRYPETPEGRGYMAYGPSRAQLDAGLTIDAFKANKMAEIGTNLRDPKVGLLGGVRILSRWVDQNVASNVQTRQSGATRAIADAKAELRSLESEAADFARRHPGTRIATPSPATLREGIATAERHLAAKRFGDAAASANGALSSARSGRDALSGFDNSFRTGTDALRSAAATVDALDAAAGRFRAGHEGADGDMARPKTAQMREQLAAAQSRLSSNPSAASSAAQSVKTSAQSALDALAAFENDKGELERVRRDLDANARTQRASAGAVERQAAQTALGEAQALYGRGESAYKAKLDEARRQANDAAAAVARADAAAQAQRSFVIASIATVLGLLIALLTWLALLAKPVARKAREQFAEKRALLDDKLEAIYGDANREQGRVVDHEAQLGNFDEKVETLAGTIDGPGAKNYKGTTAQLAEQVREDVAAMNIIFPAMEKVLAQAKELIFPTGAKKVVSWFRRKPFQQGLRLLKDEPVTFKPEDGVAGVFGKTKTWNDKLYGSIESQKPFTSTFETLVSEYNTRARRAAEALTLIEQKIFALEPTTQAVDRAAAEAADLELELLGASTLENKAASDGLLLLAPVFATLLPASEAALAKLKKDHLADPVGAIDGAGKDSGRMADDALALGKWALAARAAQVKPVYAARKALSAAGYDTAWIARALSDLSARADAAAVKAVERSIAPELKSLDERAKSIAAQAAAAVSLAERLAELRKTIATQEADVDAARAELAAATGAPAEKTLRETGFDPTKTLATAARHADDAQEAIAAGKTAEAEASLGESDKALAKAVKDVADARAAAAAQAATVEARAAEHGRITTLKPQRDEVLKEIRRRFAKSVLSLRSGDPAHPSADGTIDNNVDEASEHLEQSQAKREKAVRAFAAGNVLDAADLLRQSGGHLALAQHRLDEISEKLARLEALLVSNASYLSRMQGEVDKRKASISDAHQSQEPTREAMRALRELLKTAKEAVEEAKGDPFAAELALKKVDAEIAQVDVRFKNDVDMHNEAARSLQAADRGIQAAFNEATTAKNDGHGDSAAIVQSYNALESLRSALVRAKAELGAAHNTWANVDAEADRIANEAAKVAATLRRETQAAEEASSAITNASSKVREATGWTGRYGVYIPGSPGSGELDRARSALASGRYDDAKSYASRARSEAASAIAAAEAEVQRRYREEQEELERQRRERQRQEEERREAARRSSSGSGSGMGGGGFGGGGSSSGMGGGSW